MKREFLDFRAIKDGVSIVALCARYSIELKRRNTAQLVGNCPLPSHSNPKSTQTFCVNEAKNVWICQHDSCRKAGASGNVIDLAMRLSNLSQYDAAKLLLEWFPLNGNPSGNPATGNMSNNPAKADASPAIVSEPLTNRPLAFALKDVNPEHPMIQARGISVETARLYGAGYFPGRGSMQSRIVFSLRENGELIGYAGRTTLEVTPENPKWKMASGVHKTFAYGLEHCDPHKPLIVTESLWAPLFFHEKGMQAASLMGTDLSDGQEKALEPFKVIWLAFDNDEKGREASEKLAARLRRSHAVKVARLRE